MRNLFALDKPKKLLTRIVLIKYQRYCTNNDGSRK
jgi:hypothetical protein